MNLIEVAGHLGADPETRFTANGQKVVTLRVAARSRRGSNDETIWWRVTLWGERFDKLLTYLKKGSAIIVIGDMHKPEIFTGRDGAPQVSVEMTAEMIKFSPFGSGRSQDNQQQQQQQQQAPAQHDMANSGVSMGQAAAAPISDDDIPF